METIHAYDSPLAAFLEGEGTFVESDVEDQHEPRAPHPSHPAAVSDEEPRRKLFAPPSRLPLRPRIKIPHLLPPTTASQVPHALTRVHHAWSSAVNSRLGASDNAKFLEHFRYTIVASQLLHEYLDHGSLNPACTPTVPSLGTDGTQDVVNESSGTANLGGALSTAAAAFALVLFIEWLRSRRLSKSKVALVLTVLSLATFVGYGYLRRQWLQNLRRQVVYAVTSLTTNWQAYELSGSSALSLIQEVELVSKGYRLSTPLPPASRIEEAGASRRCAKLRAALHQAYATTIPSAIEASASLRLLIDDDDLDKYFEVYDITTQDAREASGVDALRVLEDDPESLKSLRVLNYRSGVLRRVTLCSLMALEADGGKADFQRWRVATAVMDKLSMTIARSTERVRKLLTEMENFNLPSPPKFAHTPVREKMRGQVRKLSALGAGIRGLQAKMQLLREETNNSIEQSEDLTDLGPTLMAQYEAIGADLNDLLNAWEAGKQSLQTNITRTGRRISMASSGRRSPVSSLGGLTAVEEAAGSPADALRVLSGDGTCNKSNRSSLNTCNSDEEMVFEAVASPRHRVAALSREERIAKMHEERAKQADLRAKRDANTSMLRELESVINLRPKKALANGQSARVTSL